MDINKFWKIIDECKDSAEPESIVLEMLKKLSATEIVSYQNHFDKLFDNAYRWDLWGAAYMIGGGCSDDGFIDFRYGLIGKGRNVYEKALKNPDSLAELGLDVEIENELFGYIAQDAYEELTANEIPRTESSVSDDLLGDEWDFDDEDENKIYIPKLTQIYNEIISVENEDIQTEIIEPECYIFPAMFGNVEKIRFKYGWNEKSTELLANNDIHNIELTGDSFNIPNLGKHAEKVKTLSVDFSDSLSGIEQFVNIKSLYLSDFPKNSIKIYEFKKLTRLSIDWGNKYEHEVNLCKNLLYLNVSGYKYKNLTPLKSIKKIKSLGFHRGNIECIDGINPNIEGLSLSYTSKYIDINSIQKLANLINLDIHNAKKLNGILKVKHFERMIQLNIVNTGCILDLQKIELLTNLDLLWCNNDCLNVNWKQIIALPKIRCIGLFADKITDEEIYKFAKANNKKIESLYRAGTKKKPFLKIIFDVELVRISTYFE